MLDRFPSARPVPMQSLMARGALARSTEGPVILLHRGHDRLDAAAAGVAEVWAVLAPMFLCMLGAGLAKVFKGPKYTDADHIDAIALTSKLMKLLRADD